MYTAEKKAQWILLLPTSVLLVAFALATYRNEAIIYTAGLVAAAGLLAILWRRTPRYLLFALLLYLPFEDGILTFFSRHDTVARVTPDGLLLMAFLICVWRAFRRKERFFGTPMDLPVALLILVAVASMLVNHIRPTQAIQGPYVMFRYAMVFYLAVAARYSVEEVQGFLRWLFGVAMFESVLAVVQFVLLAGTPIRLFGYELPQGTMQHTNVLGAFLAIIGIVALATFSDHWMHGARSKLFFLLLLLSLVVMLAVSRQSLAALALGVLTIIALGRWRTQVADVGYALMSIVAGTAAGYLITKQGAQIIAQVSTAIASRFVAGGTSTGQTSTTTTTTPDTAVLEQHLDVKTQQSLSARLFSTDFYQNSRMYEIAHGGLAILRQSPLLGMGPGTFGSKATFNDLAFYKRLDVGLLLSDPHATFVADIEWMNIFGQLGLLGLLGFLWIFLTIGRIGYKVWTASSNDLTQRLGMACLAIIPAFLFLGWFGPNFELRQISIFLWFLPGLALGLLKREEEQRDSHPATAAPVSVGWLMADSTMARIRAIRKDTQPRPRQKANDHRATEPLHQDLGWTVH